MKIFFKMFKTFTPEIADWFFENYLYNFRKIYINYKNAHLSFLNFSFRITSIKLTESAIFFKIDWIHLLVICVDLVTWDQPGKRYRFNIIYYILSLKYNTRFQFLTQTKVLKPLLSWVNLYKSINWCERELWDIFGIFILGHPDLRRLLNDYNFIYFPLRKDFPLSGYTDVVYNENLHSLSKTRILHVITAFILLFTFIFFNNNMKNQ